MNLRKILFSAVIAGAATCMLAGGPLTNTVKAAVPQIPGFPTPTGPNELWAVTYAGALFPGLRNGPALWSLQHGPTGMYLNDEGNLFLTNGGNDNIRVILDNGKVETYSGAYLPFPATKDGALDVATYSTPNDIKGDSRGFMYICDREGQAVRRIDPEAGVVKTIAGKKYCNFGYDGEANDATQVLLNYPQNMAIAKKDTQWHEKDTIYFNDRRNFMVRKLILNDDGDTDPTNDTYSIYDVAGVPGSPGYVNGPVESAKFKHPCGIALSNDEQYLLIDDRDNNVVRVIDLVNGLVGTYAGVPYTRVVNGVADNQFADGPADQAYFASPSQCNIMGGGPIGDLIIADRFNNRIRKVTPFPPGQWPETEYGVALPVADEVSTLAGTGEQGRSSGPADQVKLTQPWGVLVDKDLVYITDTGGNRVVVIGKAREVIPEFRDRIRAGRLAAIRNVLQVYRNYNAGEQTFQPPFGLGQDLP